mmetsp:Transcript_18950/g.35515  ORF Transcript_18950/g.35515 Transcript_18950/m.35515 type:complete len:216 (-) Transcript_18950:698-1345(-)
MLAITSLPAPVRPGEEEGKIWLSVLQHQMRNLPHDCAVFHVLAVEPVVVEHETMNTIFSGKVRLVFPNMPISKIVVVQTAHLRQQRLAEFSFFIDEGLQVCPFREALTMEFVVLWKAMILWEVDCHDLWSHGKLSNIAASATQGRYRKVPKLHLHALQLRPDPGHGCCQRLERHRIISSPVHVATNRGQLILGDVDPGIHRLQELCGGLLGGVER